MVGSQAKFARHHSGVLSCAQLMASPDPMQDQTSQEWLTDYRMQEPVLHEVFPHLALKTLVHLRATCHTFRALLDSQLCDNFWLQAAQHLLPPNQQRHADPRQPPSCLQHSNMHQHQLWLMLHPSGVSNGVRLPQLPPHEVTEIGDADVPADNDAQQLEHLKASGFEARGLQGAPSAEA